MDLIAIAILVMLSVALGLLATRATLGAVFHSLERSTVKSVPVNTAHQLTPSPRS